MKRLALALAMLAALATAPAFAADDTPPMPADSTARRALANEIVEMTGAMKMSAMLMDQMLSQLRPTLPQVPEEFWDEFRKPENFAPMQRVVVDIYARRFSVDELKGLRDFYRTPVGRKLVAELPAIVRESSDYGQAWGQKIGEQVFERLKAKGYIDS